MTDSTSGDRLDALVFQYLERVEAGETGAHVLAELCAEHADEAAALQRGVALLREVRLHPGPGADGLPERIGPFRLLRRLGAGGMGVVYLAEQQSPGRQVALKLVRPDQLWFEGYRERFTREIESAGRLAHPGIAPVYEMGEHDGVPWFSQEYVVGSPLSDLLSNVPARSPETLTGADLRAALADGLNDEVPASAWDEEFFRGSWVDVCLRVARQVADALQHAHERGVLHRDVKPSNVLLTPGGRAVLVDFGLASLQGTERLTQTGAQVGSLHYMPPEQVDGRAREVGPRSDVYSLGVTLYELLTLRAPYSSQSLQRLRGLILEGDAPPARQANGAVSRDVDVVVKCAMEGDPARRYDTAAALAADLAAAQTHRPIAARPAGYSLRISRWMRRHPAGAVGLAASVLVFVVGPLVFGVQSLRAARLQEDLNRELTSTLAERDTLLDATLDGFEGVVRWTAHETLQNAPGFQAERLVVIDEGLAIFERVLEARPDDLNVRLKQALMMRTRGNILTLLGREDEAFEQYERAVAVYERQVAEPDCPVGFVREIASLRYQQAMNYRAAGRGSEAAAANREALAHQRRATELEPGDARNHRDLAAMASSLAYDLATVDGRSEESAALLAEAIVAGRRAAEMDTGSARVHRALYEALGTRRDWLRSDGHHREALLDHREALASIERALALDPLDPSLRHQHVRAMHDGARLDLKLGVDEAQVAVDLERVLALCEALVADYPNVPAYAEQRLVILGSLAFARRRAGDAAGGREASERVVEARLAEVRANLGDAKVAMDCGVALTSLCNAVFFDESLGEARFDRVLQLCDQAQELAAPFARMNPGARYVGELYAGLNYMRGAAFNQLEDADGIWMQIEDLLALEHEVPAKHLWTGKLLIHWANRSGEERGRVQALAELERALELGFEDLRAWEQAEVESELADYPRILELGALVRQRASGE
jgi:serine/threonine protein kinase